jgi:hypothetical protein
MSAEALILVELVLLRAMLAIPIVAIVWNELGSPHDKRLTP